jgi:hypothetical protein
MRTLAKIIETIMMNLKITHSSWRRLMKKTNTLLLINFVIEACILVIFQRALPHQLPTMVGISGQVIYWYNYATPVLVPGLIFLAVLHLAAGLIAYGRRVLNWIPIFSGVEGQNVLQVLTFWLACFSWLIVIYCFWYNQFTIHLMFSFNIAAVIVFVYFVVRGCYRFAKSKHDSV